MYISKQLSSEIAILASARNKLDANISDVASDEHFDYTNVNLDDSVQIK